MQCPKYDLNCLRQPNFLPFWASMRCYLEILGQNTPIHKLASTVLVASCRAFERLAHSLAPLGAELVHRGFWGEGQTRMRDRREDMPFTFDLDLCVLC